jgi:hypothetical protein
MSAKEEKKGDIRLTLVDKLPMGARILKDSELGDEYQYIYTTGPFTLPEKAQALDWTLLNNSHEKQKVRITIFKCSSINVKTPVPPGPLEVIIDPGKTAHNANSYPVHFRYEIQVECNSQLIFPYVEAWPGNIADMLPGTAIFSANFLRHMP